MPWLGPGVLLVPPLTQSPLEAQPTDPAPIPLLRPQPGSLPELRPLHLPHLLKHSPWLSSASLRAAARHPPCREFPGLRAFPNTSGGVFRSLSCPPEFPPDSPGLHSIFFRCFSSRAKAASPIMLPVPSRIPQGRPKSGNLDSHLIGGVQDLLHTGAWRSCVKKLQPLLSRVSVSHPLLPCWGTKTQNTRFLLRSLENITPFYQAGCLGLQCTA